VIISRFGIGRVIPLNGPVPSNSPFCVSVFIGGLPIGRFSGPHPQPLANPLGANRRQSASSRNTCSRRSPQPIMWWAAPGHCGGSSRAMRAILSQPAPPVNQNRNQNRNLVSVSAFQHFSVSAFQLLSSARSPPPPPRRAKPHPRPHPPHPSPISAFQPYSFQHFSFSAFQLLFCCSQTALSSKLFSVLYMCKFCTHPR
jgi:hypothetical protein